MIYSPGIEYGLLLCVDGLIALSTGLIVFYRDPKFFLNRFIGFVMVGFSIFFFGEGLIFLFPESDMMLLNFFRDVSEVFGITAAALAAISGIGVHRGESEAKRPTVIVPISVAWLIGITMSIFGDWVVRIPNEGILTFENDIIGVIGIFLFPLAFILVAFWEYLQLLRIPDLEGSTKTRITLLLVGIFLILIGIGYYAVVDIVARREGLIGLIGHVFYSSACIVILATFWRVRPVIESDNT